MQVGTVGEVRIPPRSQWAGGPKKQHEAAVAQLSALPACHLLASLRHFAPLAAQAKLGSSHPPLMQQICRLATPTGAGGSCVVRLVTPRMFFATGLAEHMDTLPAKEADIRRIAATHDVSGCVRYTVRPTQIRANPNNIQGCQSLNQRLFRNFLRKLATR